MATWYSSEQFTNELMSFTASEAYELSAFGDVEEPEESFADYLTDWLARVRLLYGVPFPYLVPDERLLPTESIRFFYIDRNWTNRLIDGALSVGKTTTREYAHHHAVHTTLKKTIDAEERRIRARLHPLGMDPGKGESVNVTGFLLRSFAVSGWPGLEVKAYSVESPELMDHPPRVNLLRMDRMAPDILLCMFDGIPVTVDIEEPREGIMFGVDIATDAFGRVSLSGNSSGFELKLRHMHGPFAGHELGDPEVDDGFDETHRVDVPVRAANGQVLHIAALRDAMEDALNSLDPPVDQGPESGLNSAELAVQMLQYPYRQRFFGEGGQGAGDTGQPFVLDTIYQSATLKVQATVGKIDDAEVQQLFPGIVVAGPDGENNDD
jgi:hypothetical protein